MGQNTVEGVSKRGWLCLCHVAPSPIHSPALVPPPCQPPITPSPSTPASCDPHPSQQPEGQGASYHIPARLTAPTALTIKSRSDSSASPSLKAQQDLGPCNA